MSPRARLPHLMLWTLALGSAACTERERVPSTAIEGELPLSHVRIEVSVDGAAASPVHGAALRVTAPDFSEDERRAWTLARLLSLPAGREIRGLTVVGADGVKHTLTLEPGGAEVAALVLNRRNRLDLWLMDPRDPFPAFHGRGGNRGRPGHERPRVIDAQRLEVVTSP